MDSNSNQTPNILTHGRNFVEKCGADRLVQNSGGSRPSGWGTVK